MNIKRLPEIISILSKKGKQLSRKSSWEFTKHGEYLYEEFHKKLIYLHVFCRILF